MTAILTNEMKIQNAKNFIKSIASATTNKDLVYAFIGRKDPWGVGTDSNGVEIVPTPVDILNANELTTRTNILGIKRLTEADISHVVPRIDWVSGTTYAAYSNNDTSLLSKNFYVMTDQFNVYKCIVSSGSASTIKPTGTSTSNLVNGDGYTWKFLYTVSTSDSLKFLTTDWLPVPTGTRKQAAQLAVEAAASYTTGQSIGGNGSSAVDELFGFYLLFDMSFSRSENGTLPTNDDFRQVGLMLNPVLNDSNHAFASANNYSGANFNKLLGSIIYIENRAPIVRAADQTEDLKLVISF